MKFIYNAVEDGWTVRKLFNRNDAIDRFCNTIYELNQISNGIKIHIENNVYSISNFSNYKNNPFLFTNYSDLQDLYHNVKFPIILDIAHLKVSCNTLKLDFKDNFKKLLNISNYIHLSDNDGTHDSKLSLKVNSDLIKILEKFDFNGKIITLEVYEKLNKIKSSYNLVKRIINDNS